MTYVGVSKYELGKIECVGDVAVNVAVFLYDDHAHALRKTKYANMVAEDVSKNAMWTAINASEDAVRFADASFILRRFLCMCSCKHRCATACET